jgi:hypothetical protein
MKIEKTSTPRPGAGRVAGDSGELPLVSLPAEALDDRIAIVGTAGSGKTYAAKGFVERPLESGARVAIVDPLGVWWGLRASADGGAPGYSVVVFGGRHADVAITSGRRSAIWDISEDMRLALISTGWRDLTRRSGLCDSSLEGTGFEPSVPREAAGILVISVLVRADFSACTESSK